jgi:hypothetical protein
MSASKKTNMKTNVALSLVVLLALLGCRHNLPIDQVPDDVIASIPCPTLYSRILELFPEHVRVKDEQLFRADVQKQIVLIKETELYVTYLSEGAGYRNTFGWYAYDKNSPPSSASDLTLNILFPDVSRFVLTPGNRLKIGDGTFKTGTVVGFFLIIDGWEEGFINYDKAKVYTDFSFNPDGVQQHVLFQEKTCGDIVLAFEDLPLDGVSDRDFNDMLFTVSDNNSEKVNTAFDSKTIVAW